MYTIPCVCVCVYVHTYMPSTQFHVSVSVCVYTYTHIHAKIHILPWFVRHPCLICEKKSWPDASGQDFFFSCTQIMYVCMYMYVMQFFGKKKRSWPNAYERIMYTVRPAADIYFVLALLFVTCFSPPTGLRIVFL